MKLYSDFALARSRQIAGDLVALVVIVASIVVGVTVHGAILVLVAAAKQVEKAGDGFRTTMTDAAKAVSGIPVVGSGVRKPFDSASGAGKTLAEAGANGQTAIEITATVVGVVIAAIPIYFVVRYQLIPRFRFARRATATAAVARSEGGYDLLAFRALATADARNVLRLDPAVVARWRAGDEVAIRGLAALELERFGLRAAPGRAG